MVPGVGRERHAGAADLGPVAGCVDPDRQGAVARVERHHDPGVGPLDPGEEPGAVLEVGVLDDVDHVQVTGDLFVAVRDAHPGVVVGERGCRLHENLPAHDADRAGRVDVEVVRPRMAVRSGADAALVGPAEQVLGHAGGNRHQRLAGRS